MAIATAYKPVNMLDASVWYGQVITNTSTTITISDGYAQGTYTGSFTYGDFGHVYGTLTGYRAHVNGQLHYAVTDFAVSAYQFSMAIDVGNADHAYRMIFGRADTMHGSSGADAVRSYDGNDRVFGYGGNDRAWGGDGGDRLFGGAGGDRLYGENGNDRLEGGSGNDRLSGGRGNDALGGGTGRDAILGGAGADTGRGGGGNDLLQGQAGNDRLHGDSGADQLRGGSGRDVLNGGAGNDRHWGGKGADTFVFGNGSGNDRILDFDAADNREDIDLSAVSRITSFQDLKAHHMTDTGADVVIDDGNGMTITLVGVDLSELHKGDFLF